MLTPNSARSRAAADSSSALPMEKSQFCFWLQGPFEILDDSQPLSAAQVGIISAKLARAESHPAPAAGKPASFCVWLRGQLDAHEMIFGLDADLSHDQTAAIKTRLDSVFVHAAQPVADSRPPSPRRGDVQVMC